MGGDDLEILDANVRIALSSDTAIRALMKKKRAGLQSVAINRCSQNLAIQQHYHDSYEWVGSDSDDGGEDGDLVEVRQVVEVLEVVVKVGMEVVGLEVVVWAMRW